MDKIYPIENSTHLVYSIWMNFFCAETLFLGIDVDKEKCRCALLKKRGPTSWKVVALEEFSLEEKQAIRNFVPSQCLIATALPSQEVLVKSLNIPLKGEKEIAAAFNFQIEPLLPYPLEKCLPIYLKAGEKTQGSHLTALSAKKESLEKHLQFFKEYGIEPDKVFTPSLALAALADPTLELFLFMHIGADSGLCCLIERGKLLQAHSFPKELSEIEKTVLSIQAQNRGRKIETLLLLDEEGLWSKEIEKIFQKPSQLFSLPQLEITEEKLARFGIAIGLGVALATSAFPHFRTQEFSPPFPWKRVRKSITAFFLLASVLFASLIAFEQIYFKKKERLLFDSFQRIKNISITSMSQLEEELRGVEKSLTQKEPLFPLLPKVPKVRDLLSWLSTYKESVISLENFHYEMVKQPHSQAPKEHYQIKVELIFSASNPLHAEQFHSFLAQPNTMIEDLVWTPFCEKKVYKVQFLLKDKTRYN